MQKQSWLSKRSKDLSTDDKTLIIIAVIGAAAVVRLWIMPMVNSFWLDETMIVSIVRHGLTRIASGTPASVASVAFCWLEWCTSKVFGLSEVALRLPSVVAGIGTLYVFYRIGAEFVDHETGFIFGALYISLPQVAVETPNARPYAVGLWAETVALLWLFRWRRTNRLHAGVLWAICSAIAVHMHYLFGMALAVEGAFVVWVAFREKSISARQAFACGLLALVLLLPALPRVLALAQQANALSFFEVPTFSNLAALVIPVYILVSAALMAVLIVTEGDRLSWAGIEPEKDIAILSSLLLFLPAFGLFVLSRFTNVRLFDQRYLIPVVPGFVLLWGQLLRAIDPPFFRRMSLASGLVVTVVLVGGLSGIPNYRSEDWRSAVRSIPNGTATLVYSSLVETRHLDWLQKPEWWANLMAPVLTYRPSVTPENGYVVPFDIGPSEQSYVAGLLDGPLRDRDTITVIVRRIFAGPAWLSWISDRLSSAGYRKASDTSYGSVEVAVFRRSKARLSSSSSPGFQGDVPLEEPLARLNPIYANAAAGRTR